LQVQLREMAKLCELQQADLERFARPTRACAQLSERVPAPQLQLAFERVLETLRQTRPATTKRTSPRSQRRRPAMVNTRRAEAQPSRHGRRDLDLSSLPVETIRLDPPEVEANRW